MDIKEFARMGGKARWKGKTAKEKKEAMKKVTDIRLKRLSTGKKKKQLTTSKHESNLQGDERERPSGFGWKYRHSDSFLPDWGTGLVFENWIGNNKTTMTTSRMIVVLRGELGEQASLAHKEYKKLEEEYLPFKDLKKSDEKVKKLYIKYDKAWHKLQRLEKAAVALGSIQLGDIEDKDI